MRLRYTGASPITLMTLGIEVEPGVEYDLDEDAFAARSDFEGVDAPPDASVTAEGAGTGEQDTAAAPKRKPKAATTGAAETQSTDEPAATA